jgi:pimeloyl-ACP methyl ester carboxylesterase
VSTTPRVAPTRYVTSVDGTRIAFELAGGGPALVIVEGALCHRGMGAFEELAPILSDRFTVVGYDRRDRGDSDRGASPFTVQREVEDLIAVLAAVEPEPFVFGMSSGAALSLEAARQGVPISRLAVYEVPFILDRSHRPDEPGFVARLRELLGAGRHTQAVQEVLRLLGMPAPIVDSLPLSPTWKQFSAAAEALPNDFEIVSPYRQGLPLPDGHYAAITASTLLIAGGQSPVHMQRVPTAIAAQITGAATAILPGQSHEVEADAIAPLLATHFMT